MPKVDPSRDAPRRTRAELEAENRDLRTALAMLVGAAAAVPARLTHPLGDVLRTEADAAMRCMPMAGAMIESYIDDTRGGQDGGR